MTVQCAQRQSACGAARNCPSIGECYQCFLSQHHKHSGKKRVKPTSFPTAGNLFTGDVLKISPKKQARFTVQDVSFRRGHPYICLFFYNPYMDFRFMCTQGGMCKVHCPNILPTCSYFYITVIFRTFITGTYNTWVSQEQHKSKPGFEQQA